MDPQVENMRILIDFDGTLISSEGDRLLESCGFNISLWSEKLRANYDLRMNILELVKRFVLNGNEVILWTNRGEEEREKTMENLGEYVSLFSAFIFGEGKKKTLVPEYVDLVVDNDVNNKIDGVPFLLV